MNHVESFLLFRNKFILSRAYETDCELDHFTIFFFAVERRYWQFY